MQWQCFPFFHYTAMCVLLFCSYVFIGTFPDILQYYLRCSSGQINPFQQVTSPSYSFDFFYRMHFSLVPLPQVIYLLKPVKQLNNLNTYLCLFFVSPVSLCMFCRGCQGVTKHWWRCRMMWQSYWDQQHVIMPTPRSVCLCVQWSVGLYFHGRVDLC